MLFAWAGFVSAVWTFSFFANENHLNTSERESSERSWKRKCVLECVCVVIFFLDGTSKPRQSNKTACSVCIISHTNSLYTHNLSSCTKHNHTNAANHSSIFYARMHKTLASLCKLQLMWEGGKSRGSTLRMQKWKGGVSGSRYKQKTGREIKASKTDTGKDGQKDRVKCSEVRYFTFSG